MQYGRLLALSVWAGCNIAAGLPIDKQVHTCLPTGTTLQTSNANTKMDGCTIYIHTPNEGQGTRKGRCNPVSPSIEAESYWNLLRHQHKLHTQQLLLPPRQAGVAPHPLVAKPGSIKPLLPDLPASYCDEVLITQAIVHAWLAPRQATCPHRHIWPYIVGTSCAKDTRGSHLVHLEQGH